MIRIDRADLDDPALAAFLRAHLDDMTMTSPPESRHVLDLDGLRDPAVRLWVAREDDDLVGTGAVKLIEARHAEIKSMRTDPGRRGQGIASRMLRHLVDDARGQGAERVSLETGSMDFFAPARALYGRFGFTECPAFGAYREDPNSTFMTLWLG